MLAFLLVALMIALLFLTDSIVIAIAVPLLSVGLYFTIANLTALQTAKRWKRRNPTWP